MKKTKIGLRVLCLLLVAFMIALTGCSTPTPAQLDKVKPWSEKNKNGVEESTYTFSRYLTNLAFDKNKATDDDSAEKGYLLTNSGSLKYTISEGMSLSFNSDTNAIAETNDSECTLLKMEFEAVYKTDLSHLPVAQEVKSMFAGKTDTITSYTVLDRNSLATLFTFKNAVIAVDSNQSFTLVADYTGKFTGKRSAVVSDARGNKTLSIKSDEYYDSESVYFRVRALDSLENGSTTELKIAMPYDDAAFNQSKLAQRSAQQATAADTIMLEVKKDILLRFDVDSGDSDNADDTGDNNGTSDSEEKSYKLECYQTALSLTSAQTGHPIDLYFAVRPTKRDYLLGTYFSASKVLVKIEYPNNDTLSGLKYNQEFILSDYSNGTL